MIIIISGLQNEVLGIEPGILQKTGSRLLYILVGVTYLYVGRQKILLTSGLKCDEELQRSDLDEATLNWSGPSFK